MRFTLPRVREEAPRDRVLETALGTESELGSGDNDGGFRCLQEGAKQDREDRQDPIMLVGCARNLQSALRPAVLYTCLRIQEDCRIERPRQDEVATPPPIRPLATAPAAVRRKLTPA